jgi:hypothetical protein
MKRLVCAAILAVVSQWACAHSFTVGALNIDHPWARSTVAQISNGAAYLTVVNHGQNADRLLSIESPVANKVQIHISSMDNGVMRMRPVEGGVKIEAGASVKFAPGGMHIMLIDLKQPLRVGTEFPLTMHFEHAGITTVRVRIEDGMADMKMPMPMPMSMPMN